MTNRSLVLLSGESTTIPEAEARAIFLTYDPSSRFYSPEKRILVAESKADPFAVAARVAFARRVGVLLESPTDALGLIKGKKVRVRSYSLRKGKSALDPKEVVSGVDASIDLDDPDFEFTSIEGSGRYLILTEPRAMRQGWSLRRPRRRPFFHPSAIFPKLSRALVNLSRIREGGLFLDPFAGTGSLAIEAFQVGARVIAFDLDSRMSRGALSNMKAFGQEWLGIVNCDSFSPPAKLVDAIATDVPYGRLASTRGRGSMDMVRMALESAHSMLRSGSRFVLMHASSQPLDSGPGWAVEEEHNLYVHKLLTRTVSILRRN